MALLIGDKQFGRLTNHDALGEPASSPNAPPPLHKPAGRRRAAGLILRAEG